MCCGHQHENVCCRKTTAGIVQQKLEFRPLENPNALEGPELEVATVPLDVPTLLRLGGCHGITPEFAYTDYTSFFFIRINTRS
jgi:hypothetical protein